MKRTLYVGSNTNVPPPKKGIFIHDEVPKLPLAKVFDPKKHSFNPFERLDYKKACDIVSIFEALFPAGAGTLTKEGVPDVLLDALLKKPKSLADLTFEKSADPSHVSAERMVRRILRSPVLRKVFCEKPNFSFKSDIILARIDRADLGDFDALAISLFLIGHAKGHVVVPEGGFFLRDMHASLAHQGRLTLGVHTLSELPPKLRQAVLLIPNRIAAGAILEDAETLAGYKRLLRGTNEYNAFVDAAIA